MKFDLSRLKGCSIMNGISTRFIIFDWQTSKRIAVVKTKAEAMRIAKGNNALDWKQVI